MTTLKLSLMALKVSLFSTFLSFLFSLNHTTNQSLNADLVFSEPDPICSTDPDNCNASVAYSFSVVPDQIEGLQVSHQLKLDGGAPQTDTFGILSGSDLDYSIDGNYPIGDHSFLVTIEEMNGTISTEELPFSVVDCLAPVPYCINGFAVELLPIEPGNGGDPFILAIVHVEDLISSPSTDCSGPVKYSMNISGEPVDPDQDSLLYQCCLPETLIVELWAWDSANNPYSVQPDGTMGGPNYDFCETYILIQDNMFDICDCDPLEASIEGYIKDIHDAGLEGVQVNLSGDASIQTYTDVDGKYVFEDLDIGGDYTIFPTLDENPLNGVTTLDLILMTKHILNIASFDTPYKIIAADVNNSSSVTTLDMINARKVILGINDEFPNNTSWRFINDAYAFPDPDNPWAETFPEVNNINNLAEDLIEINFVAVKTGDVNGSAN